MASSLQYAKSKPYPLKEFLFSRAYDGSSPTWEESEACSLTRTPIHTGREGNGSLSSYWLMSKFN